MSMENSIVLEPENGLQTATEGPVSREAILEFEDLINQQVGHTNGDTVICPLKHSFADGIYVREIFIPAGMVIVGKIHKHEHPNFLLKGEVIVITEKGKENLVAPVSMISSPGTKRALYAVTDLVWTTVHLNPTNTQDIEKLERKIIAPSYEVYDKFIESKDSTMNKIKSILIKTLSK